MTEEDRKNIETHVKELEILASQGDETSIKSLACMALLND